MVVYPFKFEQFLKECHSSSIAAKSWFIDVLTEFVMLSCELALMAGQMFALALDTQWMLNS